MIIYIYEKIYYFCADQRLECVIFALLRHPNRLLRADGRPSIIVQYVT